MPHVIQVLPGRIHVAFSGQFTSEELMQVAEAAAKIETEDSVPRDRLVDLSAMEGMSVNFDQMNAFAEKRRSSPQMRKARTAIFAPQDLQFGLARMFQTLGAHPLLEIQVFRDLPAAVRWLEGAE